MVIVAVWLALAAGGLARPIDDGPGLGWLGDSLNVHDRIGLFRVEEERGATDEYGRPIHVYLARVVEALHGLKDGERIIFTEQPTSDPEERFPGLVVGKEYLILLHAEFEWYEPPVRALGFTEPIASARWSPVARTDLWNIHDIMPQMREYVRARFLPLPERYAALRRWALANLDTKNEFLRTHLHRDLSNYPYYYKGATREEATRFAQYSDVVGGYKRFNILEHLARDTDLPMDFWFLRAVSRGAPGRINPDSAVHVFAFVDAIERVVPKLSIDSFWPILEARSRTLSPWVKAFAQKADPRLLPIILRYLAPRPALHSKDKRRPQLDPYALPALDHYKGRPEAARALIEHVRATNDLGEDKLARRVVHDALQLIGTPDALAEARRLRETKPLASPVEVPGWPPLKLGLPKRSRPKAR
jgi:hypothetical protein